jgi:hypothetical protein
LLNFAKAVGIGALAGASPGLIVTIPIGLMILFDFEDPMGGLNAIPLALAPLIVSFPLVLAASLLLGLPLTFLLTKSGRESESAYGIGGCLLGGIVMAFLLFIAEWRLSGGMLLGCIFGMVGGSVTGIIWGREREKLHSLNET